MLRLSPYASLYTDVLCVLQNGSVSYTASYTMDTGGSFPGSKTAGP